MKSHTITPIYKKPVGLVAAVGISSSAVDTTEWGTDVFTVFWKVWNSFMLLNNRRTFQFAWSLIPCLLTLGVVLVTEFLRAQT